MGILIVNDDGPDSPLTSPLARSISNCPILATPRCLSNSGLSNSGLSNSGLSNSVTICIPERERSWIGQAITRFERVRVRLVEDVEVNNPKSPRFFLCSGTPADCVEIGVHHLCETKPGLVVSGINMGSNAGLPFFYNSGTVGAAVQAALAGIPAIAVSVKLPKDVYHKWLSRDETLQSQYSSDWLRLTSIASRAVSIMWQIRFWEECDFCSVNIPFEAKEADSLVLTDIQPGFYQGLFMAESEHTFRHEYGGIEFFVDESANLPYDQEVIASGRVSVSPVCLGRNVSGSSRQELQRRLDNDGENKK